MTIEKAMQLEEVNNELIMVLLGLTARVRTAAKMLKECDQCDHEHANVATILSTFQAEELLQRVAPRAEGKPLDFGAMAWSELQGEKEAEPFLMRYAEPANQSQADYVKERLQGKPPCTNPSCVNGLAPRKVGPEKWAVEYEPCPACGGPSV